MTNPFRYRGAVEDPWFIDREREVEEILVTISKGGNISIVGDHQIGKTSLLRAAERKLKEIDRYHVHYISLQAACNTQGLRNHLAHYLCCESTEASIAIKLQELYHQNFRTVLLLDELDVMHPPAFDAGTPGFLRSLADTSAASLITSSVSKLSLLFPLSNQTGSPLDNVFQTRELGTFPRESMDALIDTYLEGIGVRFSPDDREAIWQISGGHPFHIQLAAYHLFASKTGTAFDWNEAYHRELDQVWAERYPGILAPPPQDCICVFVSSTMRDLQPERQAAVQVCRDLDMFPIFAEEWGARDAPPYRAYLDEVARSHIYLAILWKRYGWVNPETNLSATEEEYREASRLGLIRLIYEKSCPDGRELLLERWLTELRRDHLIAQFNSHHLWGRLRTDLLRELHRLALIGWRHRQ
jgi:hypothetical protein